MPSNLDRYKTDLAKLIALGSQMSADLMLRELNPKDKEGIELAKKLSGTFEKDYQRWFSESIALIRQIMPDRLAEFVSLYKGEGRRKNIDVTTFTIQDWLLGVRAAVSRYTGEKPFEDRAVITMAFNTQLDILKSIQQRFETSLFEIRQLVQADLLDDELDGARELLKAGFLRAAGVVGGVSLEKHLLQVCADHDVKLRKRNSTIADMNDELKAGGVVDIPGWRFIQRLGDLRNLCGHQRDREPSPEEVSELLEGVAKITKTLY